MPTGPRALIKLWAVIASQLRRTIEYCCVRTCKCLSLPGRLELAQTTVPKPGLFMRLLSPVILSDLRISVFSCVQLPVSKQIIYGLSS